MINNLHNKASRLRFIHDFDALYSLQKETSSHYVCINSYVVNFFAHRQSLLIVQLIITDIYSLCFDLHVFINMISGSILEDGIDEGRRGKANL